jgi:hypothetical protein
VNCSYVNEIVTGLKKVTCSHVLNRVEYRLV